MVMNLTRTGLVNVKDDQNLSRLAAFIRTSLHSAVTSPRAHLFGIVLFQKPCNRDTFLVACLHRSIFKQQNSLKCATDLIWQAHDCASTSNHGLCSMNGNRSLLCGVIDQPFEPRTKTHGSCDCLNRNHNCDDHIFISLSVKALRQNIRTDGKNVGALVKSVKALRKNVKPIFKTVEYPSTVR